MKRQGKYGFTFDSEAEEWAAWAWSCVEHHPMTYTDRYRMKRTAADYSADASRLSAQRAAEYAEICRHSPAQQQNGCEIGEGSGRPRNRVLWPLLAVAAMALVAAAGMAGWL